MSDLNILSSALIMPTAQERSNLVQEARTISLSYFLGWIHKIVHKKLTALDPNSLLKNPDLLQFDLIREPEFKDHDHLYWLHRDKIQDFLEKICPTYSVLLYDNTIQIIWNQKAIKEVKKRQEELLRIINHPLNLKPDKTYKDLFVHELGQLYGSRSLKSYFEVINGTENIYIMDFNLFKNLINKTFDRLNQSAVAQAVIIPSTSGNTVVKGRKYCLADPNIEYYGYYGNFNVTGEHLKFDRYTFLETS